MKSFESLIGPGTRRALDEAARVKGLVSRTVPPAAAEHLLFCRLQDGKLRLVLDSAAWIARLRFGERQLVRVLAAEGLEIRQVSWHVAPQGRLREPAPRLTPRPRDARTARLVRSLIQDTADDADGQRLARALQKLASRLEPPRRG